MLDLTPSSAFGIAYDGVPSNSRSEFFKNAPGPAHKKKFSTEDFFSNCDQIRSFLRIWSHLPKNILMENFIFVYWEFQSQKLVLRKWSIADSW